MKRSRIIWILFAAFGVVLIGAIALTGGMYFRQERNAQDGSPSLNASLYDPATFSTFSNVLNVTVLYLNFDPISGLQVEFDFDPANNLSSKTAFGPAVPVCMVGSVNSLNTNFSANQLMKSISTTIGLNGDINWYPFDSYTTEVDLLVSGGDQCNDNIPVMPLVDGSVQGFTITANAVPLQLDNLNPTPDFKFSFLQLTLTAKRTNVSRAFAVLIFIVMWLLTVSLLITTAWYWITGRRVDLPIIALGTSLLFALPNIRNAQPGILARAGIISDLVGYVWNLLIVSLCVVSLIVNWIYRKDGKKKKELIVGKV